MEIYQRSVAVRLHWYRANMHQIPNCLAVVAIKLSCCADGILESNQRRNQPGKQQGLLVLDAEAIAIIHCVMLLECSVLWKQRRSLTGLFILEQLTDSKLAWLHKHWNV